MRFLQAECLGMQFGDADKIRIAPSSPSPRDVPDPIVKRDVCRERILAGDDVVEAREAKIFPDRLPRIRVSDSGAIRTLGSTARGPEGVGIVEHLRLQTGNRRTIREKTFADEGSRHDGDTRNSYP